MARRNARTILWIDDAPVASIYNRLRCRCTSRQRKEVPVVFTVSVLKPKAELKVPVVRLSRALNPSAVLKPGKANCGVTPSAGVSACALGKSAKPASTSGMTSRVVVLSFINGFMIWFFLFPR